MWATSLSLEAPTIWTPVVNFRCLHGSVRPGEPDEMGLKPSAQGQKLNFWTERCSLQKRKSIFNFQRAKERIRNGLGLSCLFLSLIINCQTISLLQISRCTPRNLADGPNFSVNQGVLPETHTSLIFENSVYYYHK